MIAAQQLKKLPCSYMSRFHCLAQYGLNEIHPVPAQSSPQPPNLFH